MFEGYLLFLFILAYLSLLFFAAYYADRREKAGQSIVSNPYVYSLSIAVYCTSWTFYGSVGKAATSGFSFLTIYIGPTLIAMLWPVILRKIIRISKEHRITTISDFIGSRYGNSLVLAAVVAIVALVGIVPYLGLQIKAIMNTFSVLAGQTKGSAEAGWFIALILGIFAIMFGARRLDSSERHEGMIFAIAFESIIKLVAFLSVGIYVTYVLFGGFSDIFDRIRDSQFGDLLYLGAGTSVSFMEWASLLFLSMMAIMFLPRQFHVTVVENSDPDHLSKAVWLFPLYLFLINIFVMPVALGGILLGGSQKDADLFVLTIPLGQKNFFLALLVFMGGFSAATGMVIVESLALSTMVMNNLVMPGIYRFNQMKGFPMIILNLKRMIIIGCVFLGYFFAVSVGEFYSLVDIGLKSFEAVTIFAPSILLGIYWKRGTKLGAIAGICAGFAVWVYTLLIPAFQKAGILDPHGFWAGFVESDMLNPHALFGLKGLDKWSHSLFWGLFFNVTAYVGISLFSRKSDDEERQALLFVEAYPASMFPAMAGYSVQQIEDVLGQYIGKKEAHDILVNYIIRNGINRNAPTQKDIMRLRDEAERVMSGALGSAIATIIFEDKLTLTEEERGELSTSIRQITDTLRLSREELAEANRSLANLKEFSESIIESAPVGIVTLDSRLSVKYWNKAMEAITGIEKRRAANQPIRSLLPWVTPELISQGRQREMTLQAPHQRSIKMNVSPFSDPEGGYVVILEDITERISMESQLVQATKLASLGKLTAGISHEIGNPLASISSLVQELRSLPPNPENREFTDDSLKTISFHIERIANIVRSLADFARVSTTERSRTRLDEVLDRTLNLVRYDRRFRKVDLKIESTGLPEIMVNPDKIQQVFMNIILNALDAMPEGGTLSVSMKKAGEAVECVFRDTGPGIDRSIMDRIFDPFFTTKPPGKGTGLGLSICYGIIKEHSGTITAKSGKDKGTVFTIRLPVT
ncbi:MAG: hypothetical protein OHK006_00950 [Thermodesulfovibrionales bacterium]